MKGEGEFSTLEGKLGVIQNELKMLVNQVMASPKSYSIWQHRVWTIEMGLNFERQSLVAMRAQKEATKTVEAEERKGDEDNEEAAELINMPGQELAVEDDALWKSSILDMEIKLCSKMLIMDERNFHCWNYRK